MTEHSSELTVADLKRLGCSYQNDFPLVAECGDGVVHIVAPRSTWLPLVVMTGFIAAAWVGFVYLIIFVQGVYDEPWLWAFLGLIGVIAIGGPVLLHQLRIRGIWRASARWSSIVRRHGNCASWRDHRSSRPRMFTRCWGWRWPTVRATSTRNCNSSSATANN
ncbi:MAG: hypothetical protein RIC55_18510 [Pirellulaceae bacterium]